MEFTAWAVAFVMVFRDRMKENPWQQIIDEGELLLQKLTGKAG